MARTPKKDRPSDKPTQAEAAKLPNSRMDAASIRHFNDKIDRELTTKNSAGGAEAQLWDAFEKAGGNKASLKMARKLAGYDSLKQQSFLIGLRECCEAIGVFDQKDMFERIFGGGQDAPAPTDEKSLREANQAGLNAGMNGKDRDTNPYPFGTDAYQKFDDGWHGGQKQLAAGMTSAALLKRYGAEGKAAGEAGQPDTANPFETGSDPHAAWRAGWMTGHPAEQDETQEDEAAAAVH